MTSPEVTITENGDVRWMRVNRPERRNALGRRTVDELLAGLRAVADDPSVRVLVLGGAGDFCTGADLKERRDMNVEERFAHSRGIASIVAAVAAFPAPTIGCIDGFALGGGCEIALACDLRMLSDRAVMGLTETRIGAYPGAGGTQYLPRIVGRARAKDLIFTGRRVDAAEAARIGLATSVVHADRLMDAVRGTAERIVLNAPLAIRFAKQAIDRGMDGPLADGLRFEAAGAPAILASADYFEGITAFAERRIPNFQGA